MFCLQEIGAKEQAPCPKGRKTTSVPGGGGGWALRAHKAGGGGLWPRPLLWFCGPFGPAKRRRPPRGPTAAAVPGGDAAPSVIRRLPRGRREARRGPMGGGGVWRRGGPMGRPACQTKSGNRRQRLRFPLFRALRAQPPPPPGPWKLPKGQMTALFRPMPRRQERSAGKGTGF